MGRAQAVSALEVSEGLTTDLLVRFLRAEAGKFGFKRALLGLSGGVDSAVSAALAARAYGAENVLGVMMPYKTSNPSSEA
ncbi:MAG: NAD(+) synthetase, partial [Planctomycetota bacterium]|nr:NAD(+) synthetase [Planctomycetota bacterium]